MKTKIAIIGAGFSGLAAASYLAKQGMQVTVFEKNSLPGGRAGRIEEGDFFFDKGPTWYWMPDVYDRFFEQFNRKTSDYYELERLSPSYRIYFGKEDYIDVPSDIGELKELFESIEKGSANKLDRLLDNARDKYELAMKKIVYKPSLSVWEYIEPWMLRELFNLDFTRSVSSYIRTLFKNPRLIKILEFPVIFLGGTPQKLPALYILMNYADLVLGSWYPKKGMYSVVEGFYKLALELGVYFKFNSPVTKIEVVENEATGLWCNNEFVSFDFILGSADYHHIEMDLLPEKYQSYSDKYWNSRELSPSALLFYVGINRKLDILHHNLLFDKDFKNHAEQLYSNASWPDDPSIYISCSSRSDDHSTPEGCENLVVTIPVAPGLTDSPGTRDRYFNIVLDRFQSVTGIDIRNNISYLKSYANDDFITEYNSFKGNAYGLANTLRQTAIFKPSIKSKKVNNLFYAGQLTASGPGVPYCIISGQVAAAEILKRI
jgi:phytoene desaturase